MEVTAQFLVDKDHACFVNRHQTTRQSDMASNFAGAKAALLA
jgi:hypothetical protein